MPIVLIIWMFAISCEKESPLSEPVTAPAEEIEAEAGEAEERPKQQNLATRVQGAKLDLEGVEDCFYLYSRHRPFATGEIIFRFEINKNNRLSNIAVDQSSFRNSDFMLCIENDLTSWQFESTLDLDSVEKTQVLIFRQGAPVKIMGGKDFEKMF